MKGSASKAGRAYLMMIFIQKAKVLNIKYESSYHEKDKATSCLSLENYLQPDTCCWKTSSTVDRTSINAGFVR